MLPGRRRGGFKNGAAERTRNRPVASLQ